MTKAQEQDRLDRLHAISMEIRKLMQDYPHENDKAAEHLERARAHIDEAWIDADGQHARTVDGLIADIVSAHNLFNAVIKAKEGARFDIGGRTFVKQPLQRVEAR